MRPITIRVSKKKLRAWKMLLTGAVLIGLVLFMGGRLRPLITTVFTYQANITATRSINDAVLEVISTDNVAYGSIIHTQEDADGRVTFLETDMVTMNRLKAQIGNAVDDRLQRDSRNEVNIPLGTIVGGHFLSGRGPDVVFRVLPAGYVRTDFYNEFQSAGINQSLHQIMLSVEVPVSAVLPLYTVTTTVSTSICVAETLIVGEVPQSFTDIRGDNRGTLEKLNDYQAKPVD